MTEMTDFKKALSEVDYKEVTGQDEQGRKQKYFAWEAVHSEMELFYYENALRTLGLVEHIVPTHRTNMIHLNYGMTQINLLQQKLKNEVRDQSYAGYPLTFIACGTAAICGNITALEIPCPLITPQSCAANYCAKHNIKEVGAIYPGMARKDCNQPESFFQHGLLSNGAVKLWAATKNDYCETLDQLLTSSAAACTKTQMRFLRKNIAGLLEVFLRNYGKEESAPKDLVVASAELSWLINNDRTIHEVIIGYHLNIIDAVALQLQAIVRELG